jgi:hypothetical protein
MKVVHELYEVPTGQTIGFYSSISSAERALGQLLIENADSVEDANEGGTGVLSVHYEIHMHEVKD